MPPRLSLPPLPTLRELLRMYELRAQKHLSQNFLLDMNLTRKVCRINFLSLPNIYFPRHRIQIVRKAGNLHNAYVCEIGPGPGGVSRAILEQDVQQFDVIELDGRFMPSLELLASASENKMRIHHADILRFSKLDTIFPETTKKDWLDAPPNVHFIGNLPFNVATPLIIRWLEEMANRTGPFAYGRTRLTLTFQKEVGERMVAPIMHRQRCRLSAMCQIWAKVKNLFIIPGDAFVPKPKVDVAVMHFIPLEEPAIPLHFKLVEKFCNRFFHYRQKYCRRGVEDLFPKDIAKKYTSEVLSRARVNPTVTCTVVSVEEIRDMCLVYEELCRQTPGLFYYDFRKKNVTLDDLIEAGLKYPPEYPFKIDNFERL